jgi:spore coat polysaccharide biosynthesis protein SpsF (cytidylyltransferase family)
MTTLTAPITGAPVVETKETNPFNQLNLEAKEAMGNNDFRLRCDYDEDGKFKYIKLNFDNSINSTQINNLINVVKKRGFANLEILRSGAGILVKAI